MDNESFPHIKIPAKTPPEALQMSASRQSAFFSLRKCRQAVKALFFLPANVGRPSKCFFFSLQMSADRPRAIFSSRQMTAARKKNFRAAVICFASGGGDNSCKPK
jgi:hypothetical protein